MLTHFLRLIALVSLIVAIIWYISDRSDYEAILALLGAIAAFVGSFWTDNPSGTIRAKKLKSNQGGVIVKGESGSDISVTDVEAEKDIHISN